ncbi:MAG: hypothetical protein R3D25_22520 [Geminicoccaceae bacterium]
MPIDLTSRAVTSGVVGSPSAAATSRSTARSRQETRLAELPRGRDHTEGPRPSPRFPQLHPVEQRRADLRSACRRALVCLAGDGLGPRFRPALGISSSCSTTAWRCSCISACPAGWSSTARLASPHEHLTFHFDDGTILRFVDPRRFGILDLSPQVSLGEHKWLAHLG